MRWVRHLPATIVLTLFLSALTPALAREFTNVLFRWNSNTHIPPEETMVDLGAPPEKVVEALVTRVEQDGGRVIGRDRSAELIAVPPTGRACWDGFNAYAKAKFAAYQKNSFETSQKIEKDETYYTSRGLTSACAFLEAKSDATIDGWRLKMELSPRWVSSGQTSLPFSSRVIAWVWRAPGEGTTHVHLRVVPTQGDAEASTGGTIGHDWWKEVTGELEATLARKYLAWLRAYETTEKPTATPVAAPPAATARLAVLELGGTALGKDERAYLSDAVRAEVVDRGGARLAVMTRENMEVMMSDMGLDASCVSEGACEVETARNLGADLVVTGQVLKFGERYVLTVKLYEVKTGRLLSAKETQGADVLSLRGSLAEPVGAMLGPLTP